MAAASAAAFFSTYKSYTRTFLTIVFVVNSVELLTEIFSNLLFQQTTLDFFT